MVSRLALARAAPIAVFTSFSSSGGGSTGGQTERVDPQLSRPADRVIEVLVFLVLDLLDGGAERLLDGTLRLLGAEAEQLPVVVVLRLGEHDALGRHQLCRVRRIRFARHLHGFDERFADVAHHEPSGRLGRGIESEPLDQILEHRCVVLGLLEILLPLLLEIVVHGALDGGPIDLDATLLGLDRLVEKLVELLILHRRVSFLADWRVKNEGPSLRRSKRCPPRRRA